VSSPPCTRRFSAGAFSGTEEWFSEDRAYLAEDDFYTRMAGLYVDLIDGEIVGSPASITADQARAAVEAAGIVVGLLH
jgi:hypothetical protein